VIYLDYHATTPCDLRVVETMLPYFTEHFGNPSSELNVAGRNASAAVDTARAQVAALIGALPGEIVFTSGATESNNIALLGLAQAASGNRRRVITISTEHKAVLNPCHELENRGFETVVLPVKTDGQVDLEELRQAITEDTLVVSIHAANNEIGTIQPIRAIAALAHEKGAIFHCDAAQAVGKIPVDVDAWDVDLLSLSAHKLYGPKGVGALYVRNGVYASQIKPLVFGGGQERNLRSGTLNVPGIVGLGAACALCHDELSQEASRIGALRDALESAIITSLPTVRRNGALEKRLPGNSSLLLPGLEAEALIANVPELALSTGSACTSGAPEPSHVLLAIGLTRVESYSTVRIGIGRFTANYDITYAATLIVNAARRLMERQENSHLTGVA